MAKGVIQADGTRCYTENCRIHDRGYAEPGFKSAIAESEQKRYSRFSNYATELLESNLGLSGDRAKQAAAYATDHLFNIGDDGDYGLATQLLKGMDENPDEVNVGDITIDEKDWDKLYEASQLLRSQLMIDAIIKQGDEVIVKETGQRGQVSEGSNFMNGRVRVSTEDGKNDFAWHEGSAVTKVLEPEDWESAPARDILLAAKRDHLVPVGIVERLMREESNPATPNAQGIQGLNVGDRKVVQEEFVEIGTRWTKGFERENATKSRYFRYIREEADRVTRRPDLTEAQSKAVSKGLNNILSYVGGNGSRY